MARIVITLTDRIYAALLDDMERGGDGLTKSELCKRLKIPIDTSITYEMRKVREKAEKYGLFVPQAVSGNGFKYVLTDDANLAVNSAIHTLRTAGGMFDSAVKHQRFVTNRRDQLTNPVDGPIVESMEDMSKLLEGLNGLLTKGNDAFGQKMKERREAINEEKRTLFDSET